MSDTLASAPAGNWVIAPLAREHDRSAFDCGHAVLNDWLRQRAGQFEQRDLARTFVAVRAGERNVAGYHALASHSVRREHLPDEQSKGLPHLDVPVVLLGRLAVDRAVQGQGLGSLLLVDALRRVTRVAEHVGVRAVEVDAIHDAARAFYLKFGFVPLLDDPRHLFLAMGTARKIVGP